MIANDEADAIAPERCPYCGSICEREFIDPDQDYPVASGPHYCPSCGAVEGGTWDTPEEFAAEGDPATGWYPPVEMHRA